jgi:hypothetical protein
MFTWLDRPVALARGRTLREILLVSLGLFAIAFELAMPREHGGLFLALYLAGTVAGALRLWPARAFGMGIALGTLAQWVVVMPVREWPAYVWLNFLAIGLLASPALVARFEGAPSRWNPWASLPAGLALRLRLGLYAVGVLVSLLCQQLWWWPGSWSWVASPAVIALLALSVAGLALGRAVALLPLAALSTAIAARLGEFALAPLALGVEQSTFLGLALLSAALAAVVSLPYALRTARASIAGQKTARCTARSTPSSG